uniref:Elicitin n=1 Tax=Albugo laibachii Nc14 TaxID=890382 RepID=F0WGN3_9STRA|nr:AlNc14C92G5761 [Albugo laibachii Nc14]|eukprot:CCA20397.1 AlNc14C92G5761 [Albugo laibachii Nc14]
METFRNPTGSHSDGSIRLHSFLKITPTQMIWKSVVIALAITIIPPRAADEASENAMLPSCDQQNGTKAIELFNNTKAVESCAGLTLANLTSSMMNTTMKNETQMMGVCSTGCKDIFHAVLKIPIKNCTVMIDNSTVNLYKKIDWIHEKCHQMPSTNTTNSTTTSGGSVIVQSGLLLSVLGFLALSL